MKTTAVIVGTGSIGLTLAANIMAAEKAQPSDVKVVMVGRNKSVNKLQEQRFIYAETGPGEVGSSDNIFTKTPVASLFDSPPGSLSVMANLPKLDAAPTTFVFHAGIHAQIAQILDHENALKILDAANAIHVVFQNTLDAADEVRRRVKANSRILQVVVNATANRQVGMDEGRKINVIYCKKTDTSALKIIDAPDDLKDQLNNWFDRKHNPQSATQVIFGDKNMKYDKVALNATINPLVVIFGLDNTAELLTECKKDVRFLKLMLGICEEIYHVGVAAKAYSRAKSDEDLIAAIVDVTQNPFTAIEKYPHHPTSTKVSFDQNEPTEVDGINGAISRLGGSLNVSTPLNRLVTKNFTAIESTRRTYKDIAIFKQTPDVQALLRERQEQLLSAAEIHFSVSDSAVKKIIFEQFKALAEQYRTGTRG
ncbi:MAG: ketopantoate reductase family protein [Burkholderiaceae bacterium]|jgi:ketopantoate reductase